MWRQRGFAADLETLDLRYGQIEMVLRSSLLKPAPLVKVGRVDATRCLLMTVHTSGA